MLGRLVLIAGCAVPLSGCDFVRLLLPRHATTTTEVRSAMQGCGITASDVDWGVAPDGTLVIRKLTVGASSTSPQIGCLMQWVDHQRIKIAYIGNEYYQR